MIYTIFSLKDTTIYEKTESLNSGIDSILELSHEFANPSASLYNSRILMKFDLSELSEKINSNKIPSSSNYFLSLRTVDVQEVPQEYEIYAYAISSSWINGTGQYNTQPVISDGVSWKYRDSNTIKTVWEPTQSLNLNVTGSFGKNVGGGTWWTYENLVCSQSFNYNSSDVYMNITTLVNEWLTGSLNNDGMIIKFSDSIETLPQSFSKIQFFSTDSNTIYVPRLHVCWDDSTFSTGSLTQINLDNINLNVKLKKYYSFDENVKIKVVANEKYPQKTYTTNAYNLKKYYLPETSYYEIRDAHSDEIIIPFNTNATKISCNNEGNYFYLRMNSFQVERFYRILIKVESDEGNVTQIYDNNYYFKVTR